MISLENVLKHVLKQGAKDNRGYTLHKENWLKLMSLCLADVSAQSDIVIWNGCKIETKQRKIAKLKEIEKYMRYI